MNFLFSQILEVTTRSAAFKIFCFFADHSVLILVTYSHTFLAKNFVKTTFLLKKTRKGWFDEIFFRCLCWSYLNFFRQIGLLTLNSLLSAIFPNEMKLFSSNQFAYLNTFANDLFFNKTQLFFVKSDLDLTSFTADETGNQKWSGCL